jgi:hypothetical protein
MAINKTYVPGTVWTGTAAKVRAKTVPDSPSCQPCADCGGLQCLCRPRFFAGQLLTEDDLNRLDSYIKAKNQLHNRYLFGSGVVCGLEVRCAPCGDGVTVMPGYALSPCGDDIVVCKTDQVDICSLIAQCTRTTQQDCSPYAPGGAQCNDQVEDWIIAIRYEETPSRGVTALSGSGSCSCGKCSGASSCGCGGSSGGCSCGGGNCGCGETKTAQQPIANKQPRRGAPPACEPTLTCEGYRYEVFKAPATKAKTGDHRTVAGLAGLASISESPLFQNMLCCLQDMIADLDAMPTDGNGNPSNDPKAWYRWLCALKQAFADHFARSGNFDCGIPLKLQQIVIPDPSSQAFFQQLPPVLYALVNVFLEEVLGCLCSAALPHCPPAGDPRVPLALVSVRRGDCSVVSVCNWTPLRKHVLTFPTMEYWFGWIPVGDILRTLMHEICCNMLGIKYEPKGDATTPPPAAPAAPAEEAAPAPAAMEMMPNQTYMPQDYMLKTEKTERTFGADDDVVLVNTARYAPAGPAGTFSEALVANLSDAPATLRRSDLVNALFTPIDVGSAAMTRQADVDRLAAHPAMKLIAEGLRPLAAALPTGRAPDKLKADDDTVAAMRGEMAALREKLNRHEDEIARLRAERG